MTNAQRRTIRNTKGRAKRRDRNQRIMWHVKDAIGAACLFGSIIGAFYIAYGFAL